jgi:hypothetical protein
MLTLTIRDLPTAASLDRSTMRTVRGGSHRLAAGSWSAMPSLPGLPANQYTFDVAQMLGQSQNVVNNNGNNVAFSSGIASTVMPVQSGANTINL